MPKRSELANALAHPERTDVSLHGTRAADRYTDDELASLGELPQLEKLSLLRQHITKIPPLRPTLQWLWIGECALESLAGIEKLASLQALWLTELPNLDFEATCDLLAELPELTEVRFGGASFKLMPAGIAKLPSLLSMQLDGCPQLDLADAFVKLGRATTLRKLSIARIPKLPDALEPLACLHSLSAGGYGDEFPSSVGALRELQKLTVYGQYKALPRSIGKLAKLEDLSVKGNPMAALPDEICDCVSLQVLDVDDTIVKTLPAQIGRLAKLRTLNASTKNLRTLPESIGQLANLRELRVPWSEKLTVPESLFALRLEKFLGPSKISERLTLLPPPVPEQEHVYIFDGDRIPADFGDPLYLDIRLREHSAPLPQLSALRRVQEIEIDTANLDDAFKRLAHAPHLQKLTIEGERTSLPESLGELVQLTTLMIDSGSTSMPDTRGTLESLPDSIGKLAALETLGLRRHAMTKLPDAIGKLANLRSLLLDPGEMPALPAALGELANLTSLYLSTSGRLTRLPSELVRCTKLASFEVSGWFGSCRIENLELLAQLPALRSLALTRNLGLDVAKILRAFAGHPLEKLDLRDTGLDALPPEIGGLAKLRVLELDSTQLTTLPSELKACTELRWISLPYYRFANPEHLKSYLPKGRWKKNYRSSRTWYERSD